MTATFLNGQVLTAAMLNNAFSAKLDADQGTELGNRIRNTETLLDPIKTYGLIDDIIKNIDGLSLRNVVVQQVESVADLDKIAKINGRTVFVKSYRAGKNKGGNAYVYDSTKANINDGGMVINGWVCQVTPTYLNPYNFGAIGDGTQNDWDNIAFDAISKYIKTTPYKGYAVHIEYGEYCVISQKFVAGQGYITTSALDLKFDTMTDKSIIVQSDNAILKVREGLHFGTFNRNTGEKDTFANAQGDSRWYANVGYILNFERVKNVVVRGHIELDGNATSAVLGGLLSNGSFDAPSYGLRTAFVERQYIENVNTHDHLTDGIYIAGTNYDYAPYYVSYDLRADIINPELNGEIRNVTSYRNGRQCLTIAGGRNLSFYNMNLYDGGTDNLPLRSMPRSVMDIEAELSPVRDIKFYNCTFKNGGFTVVSDAAMSIEGVEYHDCKFISNNGALLVGSSIPNKRFYNCYFNGFCGSFDFYSDIESERTLFEKCVFTDDPKVNQNAVFTTACLLDLRHGGNPIFNDCTFNLYTGRGLLVDDGSASGHPNRPSKIEWNNVIFNILSNASLANKLPIYGIGLIRFRDFRTDKSEFYYVGGNREAFDGVVYIESLDGTPTNLKPYDAKNVKYANTTLSRYDTVKKLAVVSKTTDTSDTALKLNALIDALGIFN